MAVSRIFPGESLLFACGHTGPATDARHIGQRHDRFLVLVRTRGWLCDDCRYWASMAKRYRITGERL